VGSYVVAGGGRRESNCPFPSPPKKQIGLMENCQKIFFMSEFFWFKKTKKFGLKTFILKKNFRGKINILCTHNFCCRKFATNGQNSVRNLQCLSGISTSCPAYFFNPRRRAVGRRRRSPLNLIFLLLPLSFALSLTFLLPFLPFSFSRLSLLLKGDPGGYLRENVLNWIEIRRCCRPMTMMTKYFRGN